MAVLSRAVSEDSTARLITCKQMGWGRGGEGLNPWAGLPVNSVGTASTSN
jgi:hypothetical protein